MEDKPSTILSVCCPTVFPQAFPKRFLSVVFRSDTATRDFLNCTGFCANQFTLLRCSKENLALECRRAYGLPWLPNNLKKKPQKTPAPLMASEFTSLSLSAGVTFRSAPCSKRIQRTPARSRPRPISSGRPDLVVCGVH